LVARFGEDHAAGGATEIVSATLSDSTTQAVEDVKMVARFEEEHAVAGATEMVSATLPDSTMQAAEDVQDGCSL
jgi:hypothetical protein